MIKKYFGTDGLRGLVGKSPITPTFFLKIGYSLGMVLNGLNTKNLKNTIIIARDTRVSGDMLCCALKTGLTAYGFNVSELGIASTPCVSYLTKKLKMKCGLMVSASHNNFKDNGLKIFDSDGNKFSSELERSIEEKLSFEITLKSPKEIGQVFKEEPYSGSLVELENVILTPHIGSYAKEIRIKMETEAAENLLRGINEK